MNNTLFHKTIMLLLLFSLCLLALSTGETPLAEVWEGILLRMNGTSSAWNPLLDERLPRLIVLLSTGASLAVSGAAMQSLFQTALATPSVLGVTAGGSLLMTPLILLQWQLPFPALLPLAAIVGSLGTLLLVYGLAKHTGNLTPSGLILMGLALSMLILAIEGALLYAFRNHWQQIQMLTELSAGSTANIGWQQVHMQLPVTIVGLWGCIYYARELDLLSLGDDEALSLGIDVQKVRFRLFLCIALLTGAALAALGNIIFFGLLLPCLLRTLYGPINQKLIPACLFCGAIALVAIETLLRFFHFNALTIGHLSALAGSPLFIFLLLKQNSKRAVS